MITLPPTRFADLCARFDPAFEHEARQCAIITATAVLLPSECFAHLSVKFKPIPRPHPDFKAAPPPPAPEPAQARGLGDLVATLADPIARASDALFGTHLVGCQPCAQRREALNRLVPKL